MKVFVQHARSNPRDWEEIDSAEWATLPKKPLPPAAIHDDAPGLVHAINIQGLIFSGYDHYAVEHLADGVRITAWSDESKPEGEKFALAWTMLRLAPDARFGGAYNTRHAQMVYAQADVKARYDALGQIENTQVVGWEWFAPPPEQDVRHDPHVSMAESDRHHGVLAHRGWMEWTDGVPAEHLDARGHLKEQRARGLYKPLGSTKTYYQRNVAQAADAVVATNEEQMTTGTAASGTLGSGNYGGGSSHLAFLFTSPASEPNNAAWPTGSYRAQLNCTAAGAGITYGMRTTGSVAGYIARYSSDLASALETKAQTEAVFSSTGLKLGTTGSVSWSAGAAGDRYAILVGGTRAASGGNQTFTLTLNTTDSFADGPWSIVYDESLTVAGSAALTTGAVESMPVTALVAGSAAATVDATNQMPASEMLAAAAAADVAGGLLFAKSVDLAASADLTGAAQLTHAPSAEVAAAAELAAAAQETIQAAAIVDGSADVAAAGKLECNSALSLGTSADAAASGTTTIQGVVEAAASAGMQASTVLTINVNLVIDASAGLSLGATMTMLAAIVAAVAADLQAEGVVSGGGGTTYDESVTLGADAQMQPTVTMTFVVDVPVGGSAESVLSVAVTILGAVQLAGAAEMMAEPNLEAVGAVGLTGAAGLSVAASIVVTAEISAAAIAELTAKGGFTYDEVIELIASGEITLTAEGQAFRPQKIFGRAGDSRAAGRAGDARIYRREGDDREFSE
jgi:hypothetical protein